MNPRTPPPAIGALSLGAALPGTNASQFAAAQANFGATETQSDGLGPIFNERSCGACHSVGALGGAGQNVEPRYGTLNSNGTFNGLAATGGSLRQLFGIGGFNPSPGLNCQSGTDANPAPGATIFAGRVTTPTFGAGLVELIPDCDDPRHRQRAAGRHPRRGALRHHPPHRRAVRARADRTWRGSAGRPCTPA